MEFKRFADIVNHQLEKVLKGETIFEIKLENKNELYQVYLNSFPEGSNPLHIERTEHDCITCNKFIRDVGGVVSFDKDGKIQTIWDCEPVETEYKAVVKSLAEFVRSKPIKGIFSNPIKKVGNKENITLKDGKTIKWNHFYGNLPSKCVNVEGSYLSETSSSAGVFERGLKEIKTEALEIVIDLTNQNSLYRGAEFLPSVKNFLKLKKQYDKEVKNDFDSNIFVWKNLKEPGFRIRNTAIGTLLQDLSEGIDVEEAVRKFESVVAPANYKRPTAIVTEGMIKKALEKIKTLGIEESIPRRYAIADDISVNNVLFVDRSVAPKMKDSKSIESLLMSEVKDKKEYKKVEEISAEDFIKDVLPSISSMELQVDNKHLNNFVSLISPVNPEAPNILLWNNNFSWSYKGEFTDSIKERVKKAGGNVTGVLRASLSWYNYDDLDLHCIEPNGNHIDFGNKGFKHKSSGMLDVDMNAGQGQSREAVENIVWTVKERMPDGDYKFIVHNFAKRENIDVGFEMEFEWGGEIKTLSYNKPVRDREHLEVATITVKDGEVVNFVAGKGLIDSKRSHEVWGIKTQQWTKVKLVTLSPNHWDDQKIGNKHFFFILDNCKNEDSIRGLYNEFLNGSLQEHRKVFEMIGSKMKCEPSDDQLSGVGFSSTVRNSVLTRFTNKSGLTRVLRINF